MTKPSAEDFIQAAREFCAFAEEESGVGDTDLWRIREMLLRLIYHIPAVDASPQGGNCQGYRIDDAQYQRIVKRFTGFSFGTYRVAFDPHDRDDAESVFGLLSDDLADIYRDLREGLSNHEHGHYADACSDWSFSYKSHWARHAVSALAALEIYRTDNYLKID